MFSLSPRSREKLEGVHPDLVKVVELAIQRSDQDFSVHEGLRNIGRQKELFKAGKSKTMNSRHLTGHAVDLYVRKGKDITWDHEPYERLAVVMLSCAQELHVDLQWGGSLWAPNFIDAPHFQLSHKRYPA